jgi:transcriptional regulator with XRE-family HTH domain
MTKNNEYAEEFGEFIREGRVKRKITQKEVADKLGVSQSYYSLLERGERRFDLEMADKTCGILGINRHDFRKVADSKTEILTEKAVERKAKTTIGEMLTGMMENKSEGRSVSMYLTTEALENLEKFAKANGCSKSKAADLIFRKLY